VTVPQPQQIPPRPRDEPIFQVRTTKHTGALFAWFNQRTVVTGTYAQCVAAINDAQTHNMLAGWWSVGSLLWNPISLSQNASARTDLARQAHDAAGYGQWWAANHGAVDPSYRPWAEPPYVPPRKWWLWIPLGILGLIIGLFTVLVVIGLIAGAINEKKTDTYGSMPQPAAVQVTADSAPGIPAVVRLG